MKDAKGHGSNSKGAHASGVENLPPGYHSRASGKSGRVLSNHGPYPDREQAAQAAWDARPNAKQVSTSRGPFGMDIRWHAKLDTRRPTEIDDGMGGRYRPGVIIS